MVKSAFWGGFEKRAEDRKEDKPSLTQWLSRALGRSAGRMGTKDMIDRAANRYKDVDTSKLTSFYKEHAQEPFSKGVEEGDSYRKSSHEKRAKLTPEQRESYEKEIHEFNKRVGGDIGRGVRKAVPAGASLGAGMGAVSGAINGIVHVLEGSPKDVKARTARALLHVATKALKGSAIGGAAGAATGAGSALFWKHRSPEYLKKVTDKNLERDASAARKYKP